MYHDQIWHEHLKNCVVQAIYINMIFFFNIDRLLLQTEYKLLVQLGFTLILRGILEYTFKSNNEYTLTLFIDIIYEYE